MAKVALLIMENNRLRWLDSQRSAELIRIRTPVVVQQPPKQIVVQSPPPPPQFIARPVIVVPPPPVVISRPPECPTCHRPLPAGMVLPTNTISGYRPSAVTATTAPVVYRTSGTAGTYSTAPVVRTSGTYIPTVNTSYTTSQMIN